MKKRVPWNDLGDMEGMSQAKRPQRLVALAKYLADRPSRLFPFSYFCHKFGVAKATLSEDIQIVREGFERFSMGEVKTVAGPAGGVYFHPTCPPDEKKALLSNLATKLSVPERIVSGGYIYTSDLLFDPAIAMMLGEIIYERMSVKHKPDYIMTVETKGIPLALMTAKAFGVPLVIARRDSRVTEGSSVGINYLSGSTKLIQTMSLPKRALPADSSVIIIDDFMKAGGTAKGLVDLAHEVGAKVLGVCVFMATKEPRTKLLANYSALLCLQQIDEIKKITEIEMFPEVGEVSR